MISKKFFEKHYSRIRAHGIFKAVLCGLMIGLFANFATAAVAWLFDFGGIWLGIGIGAGVAVISGVVLYFVKFKPTTKQIAHRVDRLGLEERLITMLDLEHDESYIAMRQRENAKEHLKKADPKKLRLQLSKAVVVLVCVSAVLAAGMTTVVGLAESDTIPTFQEIVNPEDPMANYIAVSYMVEEGGEIEGITDQLLLPGESTTPVVAVAEDGWVFVGWDDGYAEPERFEENVTEEMVLIALFEEIADGEGEGEGSEEEGQNGGQEGDKADDIPGGNDANVSEGEQGNQNSDGSAEDGNGDTQGSGSGGQEQGKENSGAHGQGAGAGGKWEDNNQFIDGETYYRDHLDTYYEMAMEIFEETGEIPPEFREFFEAYFGSI